MTSRHKDGGGWEAKAGYSRAARRGNRIAVSGTTADAHAIGDTATQTQEALRAALSGVEALGGTIEDVIRTRVYLTPEADWRAASEVHRRIMGTVAPANTMLYVHRLIGDGLVVEIEIDAEVLT